MKLLVQRVSSASVQVADRTTGAIGLGLLVFVGFEQGDTEERMEKMADKLLKLRILADEHGKMNRSVLDLYGAGQSVGLLVVSQFTLAADCRRGNRPGFDHAMAPQAAREMVDGFVGYLKSQTSMPVETGEFGAHMAVSLMNDGPVTLWLCSQELGF